MRDNNTKRYDRSEGCVCFEKSLFIYGNRYSTEQFVVQLQTCNLTWYWNSESAHYEQLTRKNEEYLLSSSLTLLNSLNAKELVNELCEFDSDGYGKGVVIFGTSTGVNECLFSNELSLFNSGKESCVQIVILLIGDSMTQFVFVTNVQNTENNQILKSLGIDIQSADILKYEKLGVLKFDLVFQLQA